MIIIRDKNDLKIRLKLKPGWLPYKAKQKYIGTIFSDTVVC